MFIDIVHDLYWLFSFLRLLVYVKRDNEVIFLKKKYH